MLREFFRKKKPFDDAAKTKFIDAIVGLLEVQKVVAGKASIDDGTGHPKRKAIGYVYGYIDAALRSIGQDMSDVSVGVPITFQVIRKLWPDRAAAYTDFLAKNIRSDELIMIGVMHGGQQYVEYSKPGAPGAPMGLARFMVKGDETGRERSDP